MFTRKGSFSSLRRTAVLATVAAMALTAVEPAMAQAGSAPAKNGVSAKTATSDATDFSARRRGGGGGAAAAAAFAGIVGTGLAIAATQNRRDDYYYGGRSAYYGSSPYDSYGYYESAPPAYYGGAPAYYDGGGYGYGSSSRGRRQGYAVPDGK